MGDVFHIAELSDYDIILDVFSRAVARMNSIGIDQWDELYPDKETLLVDIQSRQMYVYCVDTRPTACVVLNEEQSEEYQAIAWHCHSGRVAVVHRLCVDPQYQNRGIAAQMLTQAEALLKQQGYTSVRLDVFSQNPYAIKLYERAGYVFRGEVFFRKGRFFCYEKELTE